MVRLNHNLQQQIRCNRSSPGQKLLHAPRRSPAASCCASTPHNSQACPDGANQVAQRLQNMETSTSYSSTEELQGPLKLKRRTACLAMAAGLTMATGLRPQAAAASKLPAFADGIWESMGGGPSDLYFPEEFIGTWVSPR